MNKKKCRGCKWLNLKEHSTIGYECEHPTKEFRTVTGRWKYKHTPACKLYESRNPDEEEPEPYETETITITKGALKARQGRFVIYDVEFLKRHIENEARIYGRSYDIAGYSERLWKAAYERGKAESKDVLAEIKAEIEQKCCITVGSENEPAITLYDVFQIIDKYKAEQKWIPCEERLPEEGGDYLVTTKWEGSYSGDTYIETNMAVYREKLEEWDCKGVIAWMPLPEPYKAESEDKPTGRWIDIGNEGLVFKCSICGTKKTIESHYCPNCGARMEAEA